MKDMRGVYRPVRKHIYRLSLRWTGREDMGGGGPVVNQKPVWKTTIMSLPHAVNRLLPSSLSLFQPRAPDFFSIFFLHCLSTCIISDVLLWAIGGLLCFGYNFVGVECTILSLSRVCVALFIAMSFFFCPLCNCPPTQQWKNVKKTSVNAKEQWTKYWKYVLVELLIKSSRFYDLNWMLT